MPESTQQGLKFLDDLNYQLYSLNLISKDQYAARSIDAYTSLDEEPLRDKIEIMKAFQEANLPLMIKLNDILNSYINKGLISHEDKNRLMEGITELSVRDLTRYVTAIDSKLDASLQSKPLIIKLSNLLDTYIAKDVTSLENKIKIMAVARELNEKDLEKYISNFDSIMKSRERAIDKLYDIYGEQDYSSMSNIELFDILVSENEYYLQENVEQGIRMSHR